jgi:hypothetical protein
MSTRTKRLPPADDRVRVTRADIVMPSDSGRTVEQLQADIDQAKPAPKGPKLRNVRRPDLHIAESVFQWRGSYQRDEWTRTNHIYNLAKALRSQGVPLDPLLVMPVADSFYVIDGHHRLAAYDTAGWNEPIPVEVFAGNLAEARLEALGSNAKDKLPMTTQAKSEAAWKITKEHLGNLTARRVATLTAVSERQVRFMRKVWRELNGREDVDGETLPRLNWIDARSLWEGNELSVDFDQDAWREQKVQDVIALIKRHNLAKGLLEDPEVTALVLQRLKEGLPGALIEHWAADHQELISELAERIASPPEDLEF